MGPKLGILDPKKRPFLGTLGRILGTDTTVVPERVDSGPLCGGFPNKVIIPYNRAKRIHFMGGQRRLICF
jgi:hypothetical protein